MKKIYLSTALMLIVLIRSFSQITFSLPTTKFCPGQIFPVSFTFDPSLAGHTFQVQLSDASGSFTSGVSVLGSGTSSPISCSMISNLTTYGLYQYKIRLVDFVVMSNISRESDIISVNNLEGYLFVLTDSLGSNENTNFCTGSIVKLFPYLLYFDEYAISYQWRKTSSPSLIISTQNSAVINQAGDYNFTISKPGCANGVSLTNTITYSSTIRSYVPYSGDVHCTGSTLPLIPSYVSQTVSYEWKKDGTIISTNRRVDATSSGNYSVKVTDKTCQTTSNAPLIFGNNVPAQINNLTDTLEVCFGSSVNLLANVNFIDGNTVEWFRNGLSVSPSNQFQSVLSTSIEGIYTAKFKEGVCTTVTNPIILKGVSSFTPKITSDLENTFCVVSPNLTVDAPLNFTGQIQWQKDGINLLGAIFFIYNVSLGLPGFYTVKLTQGSCQGTSLPINITSVVNNPPYNIVATQLNCSTGYRLSLLYPRSSYIYQWFKDGIAISGAISKTYDALTSGIYKVRITISSCVGFSQDLTMTIGTSIKKPTIITNQLYSSGAKPYQCFGNLCKLIIKDTDINYAYTQWKKDGINIQNPSGATNYFYATQTGNYSLQYTFGSCTVESNIIKINIGDKQQSLKTNNWNDQSTWVCGTVPTITDGVLINKGHTVSLPNNYTGFLKNLELNGVLNKGTNAQLKFQTN